ncbi:MAG: glycoside hydrolase family 65 [Actinomycetota bacterium]|nr:glycoside hydrolase family 65 [Actinomycetota bacterium]
MIEAVVVHWGPATTPSRIGSPGVDLTDLTGRLAALLEAGIDVVVVPAAGHAGPDLPSDRPGRLVIWAGADDATDWARRRLVGAGRPAAVLVDPDAAALDHLLDAHKAFPAPVDDAAWRLEVEDYEPGREQEAESWLTVGNGRTGTRGSLEDGTPESHPALYVAGLFGWDPSEQAGPELVRGPEWTVLAGAAAEIGDASPRRRILDLRQGVVFRDGGGLRASRFASLAERAVLVLEAEGARLGDVPAPPAGNAVGAAATAVVDGRAHISLTGRSGGLASFAIATTQADGRLRRLVAVDRDGEEGASASLARAEAEGIDGLRARHRRAWRERWVDADVVVDGDAGAQRDLRFALYHLISAGDPESDRASIGARAMTGPGYRGHVFWDTEIFVLPFFVWTHPETARALLAYRHRTLPAARAKAARLGYAGALYAWESADTGEETTPEFVWLPDGTRLTILTGVQEHHIAADVAWAACHYRQVTGDDAFMAEMGAEIVLETARFWRSRAEVGSDGRHHIRMVIGPDEYHEGVDDNAYTNVLARWNLRTADRLCEEFPAVAVALGVDADERSAWLGVAEGLVDGFDPETLLYEQFDGFFDLEGVRAVDLAPRPFTGEMVVGVERLRTTQVVKQADVIMLGLLLPDVAGAEVATANYRYYEPRTSHGSSLSPAIHALVAARVGDLEAAEGYFDLAGGVDLDNRMGNAHDGVHIATMGGLWQAAVFGFGGVRADGEALRVDPCPAPSWRSLAFGLQWRGVQVHVEVTADRLALDLDGPAAVAVGLGPASSIGPGRFVASRDGGGWSQAAPA